MGQATILSGGTDGRYTIELDFGEQYRLAVLDALAALLVKLDADIAAAQARKAEADIEEANAKAQLDQAISDQIAAVQTQGAVDNKAFQAARAYYIRAQAEKAPIETLLQALQFDRAGTVKRIATWQALQPLSQRQAWCADFTEDGSGSVATLEINGEPELVVVAPGARVPLQSDGVVRAREVLFGPQAYLNAALLPGWQRHLPTYRWGTIHDIDVDTNRCRVNLASATSSAQNLPINAVSVLTNVPVQYMTCNAVAFEEGDRVVVEFQGRDWAQPRVIGFLDNPRPCELWEVLYRTNAVGGSVTLYSGEFKASHVLPTVTAPAPVQPYPFVGWSKVERTRLPNGFTPVTSITYGPLTLSVNDGVLGQRLIERVALYRVGPSIQLEYRITNVQWLTVATDGVQVFASISGNFTIRNAQDASDATVYASGSATSGVFVVPGADPIFGVQGVNPDLFAYQLNLQPIASVVPSAQYSTADFQTGAVVTWTAEPSGGQVNNRQLYVPTSASPLVPA